jgi:phage-related protein
VPQTEVVLFSEDDGSAPLLEWLDAQPAKVQEKCIVRLERLREMGHELRRPEADFLRDDIHELRLSFQKVQYRMLYFFFQGKAVVTHGLTKEGKVPDVEVDRALNGRRGLKRTPTGTPIGSNCHATT